MNGRIYDQNLGRFISADPFVQFPESGQSYNRYTYVNNNPLAYTDPSGYFSLKGLLLGGVVGAINPQLAGKIHSFAAPFLNVIPGCQIWCAALSSAVGGYLQTGDVEASLKAGAFTAAGSAIGLGTSQISGFATRAVVGGIAGGALSKAGGGRFGDGFLGGMAGSLMSGMGSTGNIAEDMIAGAIAGGTASVIGGGKFANGAISGAMTAAFGNMAQSEQSGDGSFTLEEWEAASPAERQRMVDLAVSQTDIDMNPETMMAVLDLPALPQGVVDFAAGFGDGISFGATRWFRESQGIGSVNYDSIVYDSGQVAGIATTGAAGTLRGAAWLGGTRAGHVLNHNRYLRIGPGRMPANGRLPAGTHVPRMSIGRGPNNPHIDLRAFGW